MLIYLGETSPFYLLILDVINWFMFGHKLHIYYICEPGCEKTGLRGFRPGPTQTGLYNNRRWLEALKIGLRKLGDCNIYSENKGADQLRSYCAANLLFCFRICKKPVFSQRGSYDINVMHGVYFLQGIGIPQGVE